MADSRTPVWYFAGVAILLVGAALAYRILNPGQSVTVTGDGHGMSVTLGTVTKSIDDAQASVDAASKALEQQREQIATLEGQVSTQHDLISALLVQISQMGNNAPVGLRASANAVRAHASQPFARVAPVDASLLTNAATHLAAARAAAATLSPH